MTEDLFAVDRLRTALITGADSIGYLGALETPAQACRAAYLAGEVGAIDWDRRRWPELAYGVWSDAPQPQDSAGRRRLNGATEPAELSTWLQLRANWPQLGGSSMPWPLPGFGYGLDDRLSQLVMATADALNATFRAALWMSEALTNVRAPAGVPLAGISSPVLTSPAEPTVTFTATALANTEAQVSAVLAGLVGDAERHAAAADEQPCVVNQLNHTVTALLEPEGGFLVTLTATIESVYDRH